jgi:hypothetical protein
MPAKENLSVAESDDAALEGSTEGGDGVSLELA